jgi:hypothetical protein
MIGSYRIPFLVPISARELSIRRIFGGAAVRRQNDWARNQISTPGMDMVYCTDHSLRNPFIFDKLFNVPWLNVMRHGRTLLMRLLNRILLGPTNSEEVYDEISRGSENFSVVFGFLLGAFI